MIREKVIWKLFGKKLISYKKLDSGEIIDTGLLNPLANRLKLVVMTVTQAIFFRKYRNLGKWRGHRVSNTFAPPSGSGPMFRSMRQIVRESIFRHPYPVAMTFAVTYKCQCNCVHCSAGKHRKKGKKELTTKEARDVIDQSQDLGIAILAFTGGEPLLRPDIFDLIAHVDKKKTVPLLFTNGLYLTEENIDKLVKSGLYSLFVSIDSPYPEEHDKGRRTPGLFKKAIKGIKLAKEKGLFVGFSSYASRSTTDKRMYKKIYSLAREVGVHNVMLFDYVPTGNKLKETSEILTLSQREEIRAFSQKIFDNEIIPPLSSQSWQNSIEAYIGGIGCLAAHIQYYMSAYGEVTPCDFTPLSFGNIREEPLKTIWKRMTEHPAYNYKCTFCRMQDERFRRLFIDPIPEDAVLPYNIYKLFNSD
jgi:MoaA/NifB/PqqE/SkfB family radical SAM enzyme